MKTIVSILLGVFGLSISVITSVLVMMRGWGVQPQSWFWIIGMTFIGHTIAQLIIEVAKNHGKED